MELLLPSQANLIHPAHRISALPVAKGEALMYRVAVRPRPFLPFAGREVPAEAMKRGRGRVSASDAHDRGPSFRWSSPDTQRQSDFSVLVEIGQQTRT
jgi:hypothetical protein